jgi:hypothetical protein
MCAGRTGQRLRCRAQSWRWRARPRSGVSVDVERAGERVAGDVGAARPGAAGRGGGPPSSEAASSSSTTCTGPTARRCTSCAISRGSPSRGINGASRNLPVRSSPRLWPPGWSGPPLGFAPSFAPRRPGADDARRGWGQAIEHGPRTTRSTSHRSILQSVVHSQRATSRRTTTKRSPIRRVSCARFRAIAVVRAGSDGAPARPS